MDEKSAAFHCGQSFCYQSGKLLFKKNAARKTKRRIPYMGKDGACLNHARLRDKPPHSPPRQRHRSPKSLTALRFPLPNLPNYTQLLVLRLTVDHPLTRVFVLMCMLHPDKPSNLNGPWLTNVAKMITGIYAAITRIYAAITWTYAAITRIYAAIFSRKLRKCHALQWHCTNSAPSQRLPVGMLTRSSHIGVRSSTFAV